MYSSKFVLRFTSLVNLSSSHVKPLGTNMLRSCISKSANKVVEV